MFEKQAIFVLGMGRSGTSAIARVLSLCGASLPELLLGANEGNPKGHWEPLEALRLNEDFLFRHGATFYDPTLRLQGELAFEEQEKEAYVEKLRTFLEACPSQRPLVLKEPRITALTDFWFEAARRAGFTLKTVIAVRHPEEVAASLATRDGASFELSSALWLKYNLLADRQTRGLPRVFVEYSNLLSDWRKELDRVSDALSIVLTERDQTEVEAFLTHDLHHERRVGPPSEAFGQPWIGRVYTAFSSAARGGPLDLEAMDEIFSAHRACERTFRLSANEFRNRFGGYAWASDLATFLGQVQGQCAVEIARRFGNVVDLEEASVDTIRAEFARQAERVSEVVRALSTVQQDLVEAQRRIDELEHELSRLLPQLGVSQMQLAASQDQIAGLHDQFVSSGARTTASREQIAELHSLIGALQAQVDIFKRSRSWRVTAPLRAARRLGRAALRSIGCMASVITIVGST